MSLFFVSKKVSYINVTKIEMSIQKRKVCSCTRRHGTREVSSRSSSLSPGTLGTKVPGSGPGCRPHDFLAVLPGSERTRCRAVSEQVRCPDQCLHGAPNATREVPDCVFLRQAVTPCRSSSGSGGQAGESGGTAHLCWTVQVRPLSNMRLVAKRTFGGSKQNSSN